MPAQGLGRWYEVFAYRVGAADRRVVAVLFSDITERRNKETRFLAGEDHLRKLNATLRSNESDLRLLLDTLAEGFYAIDRDGVTTACNAAFVRMMGFASSDEVIGRRLHDLIHHSHADGSPCPEADCPILRAARDGVSVHCDNERFHPLAGAALQVEYWATPIVQDNVLQGAICTFQDVTERRRQEMAIDKAQQGRAALLQLSDRLRNLDDMASMAAVAAEIAGRTLGVSAAGLGRVDAIGETLTIERVWATEPRYRFAGTHSLRHYGSYIDDLLANVTVAIGEVDSDARTAAYRDAFELAGVRAFLNVPVLEHGGLAAIFCVTSAVPRTWTGEEIHFVQEVAERTSVAIERRRAEVRLHDLNARLESEVASRTAERDRMWNTSPDLLMVLSPAGVFQHANPAWQAVLGYDPMALVGLHATDLAHPEDLAATRQALDTARHSALPLFENRCRHKNGSYR